MIGVISKILPSKGYGFVRTEDGLTWFLHARQMAEVGIFDTLREGMSIEFTPAHNGPKADGRRANDAIRVP